MTQKMSWPHQSRTLQSPARLALPLVRAYTLAYTSTTLSQLLDVLLCIVTKSKTSRPKLLRSICDVFIAGFNLRAFPAFAATIVGGYTVLQEATFAFINHILRPIPGAQWQNAPHVAVRKRAARFVAALVTAWFSLQILNRPQEPEVEPEDDSPRESSTGTQTLPPVPRVESPPKARSRRSQLAGSTIDLTAFTLTQALSAAAITIWHYGLKPEPPSKTNVRSAPFLRLLVRNSDTLLFVLSSSTIMYSWFYHPRRLPPAYRKWISTAAAVDSRLIRVLRLARSGRFRYGCDSGSQARLLQDMCREYGWPLEWGDPEKVTAIPCEMVHMGRGPNCHKHALVRFVRAFEFAMATNLPLDLFRRLIILLYRRRHHQPSGTIKRIILSAMLTSARSSAFLAAFISSMYYGICLSRTRLGPRLLPSISQQRWDSGLCVQVGCALCGWSILLEEPKRRGELALFVAPRAVAALLPRSYDEKYFYRERAVFALGTAIVFTCAQEQDTRLVRGWVGGVLRMILK